MTALQVPPSGVALARPRAAKVSLPREARPGLVRLIRALFGTPSERLASDLWALLHGIVTLVIPNCNVRPGLADVLPSVRRTLSQLGKLRSGPELDMFRLLQQEGLFEEFEAGLSVDVVYVTERGGTKLGATYPDFTHRVLPIAIFVDSNQHHACEEDRARDFGVSDALEAQGWRVIRVTTRQVRAQPALVREMVVRARTQMMQHVGRRAYVA